MFSALLNAIKSRRLDTLFELEEKIMAKSSLDRPIMEIISDPDTGTPDDKMRLFIIYYILSHSMTEVINYKY